MSESDTHDFANMRITVMGLGHYGGGVGAARYLVNQCSAHVLITDLLPKEKLSDSLAALENEIKYPDQLALRLGEHVKGDFTSVDLVVANPAVPRPWHNEFINAAIDAAVPVTTEIRLLSETIPVGVRVVGVTGTAGKSTTTAMIQHILSAGSVNAHLGGNLGGSLLGQSFEPEDVIVLELSSAMLYWLGEGVGFPEAPGWSPDVAVLTNLAPNHLDWHETFEHYAQSKQTIFRYQSPTGIAVRGENIESIQLDDLRSKIDIQLPGEHNIRNALVAIVTCRDGFDIQPDLAIEALRSFRGLPHRLELVHETSDGCRYFNDSKSTTPEATCLAVRAFENPSSVHLIAGGYDKKIDLAAISKLAQSIAGFYAIGATGEKLARDTGVEDSWYLETLDRAVEAAVGRMKPGDVLLLSPGCASWDQFTNFEERGRRFAELVRQFASRQEKHA